MQIDISQLAQEAVLELSTVNDLVRWAVSRFNESDVYFGHGTDNPWDESAALVAFALNLPPFLKTTT